VSEAPTSRPSPEPRGRAGSKKQLTVETLGAKEMKSWSDLVKSSDLGSAYSLPEYLDALCAAGGGTYFVLGARRGAELVGGIAVYERRSPLGTFVAPRLLLFYNGFVLRNYQTKYPSERTARQSETVAALAEALAERKYGRLELRTRSPWIDARPLLDRGWHATPSYTYVVPLTDLDDQWTRVEQNIRRLVERARGLGMTITVDEDFDSFYRLHLATAERKGAPLYLAAAEFRRYYEELRDRELCRLYHARLADGRVAASQLVLTGHPVTHTVSAAADSELQQTGANAFLRWSALEDLAARGHVANDLTDASFGPVAHFKSQLGSTLETCLVTDRAMSPGFRLQYGAYRASRSARSIRRRGPG
jgi:Acetyltransferase (GNAT) domain